MHISELQSVLAGQLADLTAGVLLLEQKIAERQANGHGGNVFGLKQALAARRRQADAVQERLRTIV